MQGYLLKNSSVYCFIEQGFFSELGFGIPAEDLRLERRTKRGRTDVVLRGFTGRPICVIEFKKPRTNLSEHESQLHDYIKELLPRYGALTNGNDFWLYERTGKSLTYSPQKLQFSQVSVEKSKFLFAILYKRKVELDHLDSIKQALVQCRDEAIQIDTPEEAGGKAFISQFALDKRVAFGKLTLALYEALPPLIKTSNFTKGAFEFWRKVYARDLKAEDAPKTWKAMLGSGITKKTLQQFMFALETAYALLSRLMLVKAMQDANFPHLNALSVFESTLDTRDRHGVLQLPVYLEAVQTVIDEGGQQAFTTLFASDIFDWWQETEQLSDPIPLCGALAEASLAIFQFDFSKLSGDLLGALYQSYFDAEARKALGEFYTPPEVVEFILDHVGYQGSTIRTKNLLDPACGSGTFLIHALKRYLKANQGRDPSQYLVELIEGLHIVGFDINPFACLMAQVNYAMHILPQYAKALQANPEFALAGLPIFRTDSLRKEVRSGEVGKSSDKWTLALEVKGDIAEIQTELPIRTDKGFLSVKIPVPRADRAMEKHRYIDNIEEYFLVLRGTFAAVREKHIDETEIRAAFEKQGLKHAKELAAYVAPSSKRILNQLHKLRDEYQDGRFLKTLEDLALAMVLKNDMQFDFVVGNPPYVRIQQIPEESRKYWQGKYEWAEGNFDIYIPFIERAVVDWLKQEGRLGFICSNRFMLANYAAKLREQLPTLSDVQLVVDLRDTRVFKDALNYPAILTFKRTYSSSMDKFKAVRVFKDPATDAEDREKAEREAASKLFGEINQLLKKSEKRSDEAVGEYADSFVEDTGVFLRQGWYMMQKRERKIFEKLQKKSTHRLEELTLTHSGGFQGLATGLDDVFVLKFIENRGNSLYLKPKGGSNPVEIEKALLKPWLFGRDVERWHINWAGWHVLFPYIEIEGTYRLIPSRAYLEKFEYASKSPYLIESFQKAFVYLKRNEIALRKREGNRYTKGKSEEHEWYGVARPQNLDLYEKQKLLIQGLSTRADVAFDKHGFVFAASGAGQAYGILPDIKQSPGELLSTLPKSKKEQSLANTLSQQAKNLSRTKAELRTKERERAKFPVLQLNALKTQIELYPLSRLSQGSPQAKQVRVEDVNIQAQLDDHWALTFGRSTWILPSQDHAKLTQAWLKVQGKTQH